jgi:hypothetical protein
MGLDMYFYKKSYVSKEATIFVNGVLSETIKPKQIIQLVVEEVGYWRKFNALHEWFVDNCGGGDDNCEPIDVDIEQMQELLDTLKQVQTILNNSEKITKVLKGWGDDEYTIEVYNCEDQVRKLFSPTEGFFFGSTEINTYYKEQVDYTVELIENLLKEAEETEESQRLYGNDAGFYYLASW